MTHGREVGMGPPGTRRAMPEQEIQSGMSPGSDAGWHRMAGEQQQSGGGAGSVVVIGRRRIVAGFAGAMCRGPGRELARAAGLSVFIGTAANPGAAVAQSADARPADRPPRSTPTPSTPSPSTPAPGSATPTPGSSNAPAPSRPDRTSLPGAVSRPSRRHTPLPLATDLASAPGRRHLVLFSVTGCPYCEIVRSRHLRHRIGQQVGAVTIAVSEVIFDQDRPVAGLDGRPTTHRELAARLGIRFAPTVIAVDANGRLAGEPIVGALLDDFYGAYVDRLIEQAVAGG